MPTASALRPIADHDPGHQNNRRVEIIATDHVMPDPNQSETSPDRH